MFAERLRVATECTKQIGFHDNKVEVLDSAFSLVASRHRQHQDMTGPEWGVLGTGACSAETVHDCIVCTVL